ncbi:hypothetical protein GCM10029978_068530 [Actinoallomurus acanthiterrae]
MPERPILGSNPLDGVGAQVEFEFADLPEKLADLAALVVDPCIGGLEGVTSSGMGREPNVIRREPGFRSSAASRAYGAFVAASGRRTPARSSPARL